MKSVLQEYLDGLALSGPEESKEILAQAVEDDGITYEEFNILCDKVYPNCPG